ncbi:hypothetical protein [Flavobacterium sp.]|uniref:hypothetical protein n=1 Tax=Flavobacterium sp. TaxID=239 RepID=UPI0037505789
MDAFLKVIDGRKLAFKISFIYVAIATLSVCSIYPDDFFYGEWSLIGLVVTFPVSIISFGYRFAESNLLYPVFIIQLVMFFITFLFLSFFIKDKVKSNL